MGILTLGCPKKIKMVTIALARGMEAVTKVFQKAVMKSYDSLRLFEAWERLNGIESFLCFVGFKGLRKYMYLNRKEDNCHH